MIPELRKEFNAKWKPELYQEFLRKLDAACGGPVGFRCSETPIFLPKPLLDKAVRYGRELYEQLASDKNYREASEVAIPDEFRVPNEPEHPLFVQADFGLVREEDGSFEPKLVEIQGFPSVYCFQAALAEQYRSVYRLDPELTSFLDGHDESSFKDLLRRVILNGHDPANVALLEIDPFQQKTACDFHLTRDWLGLRIVDVAQVRKQGSKLYTDGVEIKRIYNRVIYDELVRKNIPLDFAFSDQLDVEWAGHPNWFFRLSKFSLPWFRHVSVPETSFLSDVNELPEGLSQYVLKPLYSFAGFGVKIAPSKEEIQAIPEEQRGDYILQRRMQFVPTVETPSGPTKIEIRVMYVWDGELKPVTTVLRSGRGPMMGVDFNKSLDWVGASAGFYLPDST